jgi:hypothetical protein
MVPEVICADKGKPHRPIVRAARIMRKVFRLCIPDLREDIRSPSWGRPRLLRAVPAKDFTWIT